MIDVVDKDKDLPAYVFSKRFGNHLFFDADITRSDELLRAIKDVVLRALESPLSCAVFSAVTWEMLGVVALNEGWAKKVTGFTELMHKRGNYYGYVIVDSSLRWAAYQKDPVSLGYLHLMGKALGQTFRRTYEIVLLIKREWKVYS
jgi:hypothetical protein